MTRKPSRFGKYLLLDRIAVGGMAEVFVAKAFGVEGFERLLAIKKILPTMGEDPEFISMFVDEARIAVQLSHANIVQILELGKHDENLYIAMEYIAGRDVRQVLERFRKRGRPMPVPQACLIIAKVCEALDYAHRKHDAQGRALGIVHRDVSPQNVLVSYEGDIKLIDFGIAKAESRLQKTQAGILKGKFSYMSPEQVRGLPIDHRSDVFAVGVVLWELLTGEKLFTGDSDFAVLEKVRQGLVPPPRQLNPAIPETLQNVVLKALAAESNVRYQWASELHDDLMRFCVVGDMMYGSRQLAEWMREEFTVECEREQERLRVWMSATLDGDEPTPPTRLPPERKEPVAPLPPAAPTPVAAAPAPRFAPPTPGSMMATAPELPSLKGAIAAAAAAAASPAPSLVEIPTQQWRLPADNDTLALPPTPAGGSSPVSADGSSAASAAVPAADRTPAGVSLQELPTMKMDGDMLIEAERAFFARQAAAKAPAQAGPPVDDEPTNKGAPRPLGDPSLKVTVPEGVFAAMVADSMSPAARAELSLEGVERREPSSNKPTAQAHALANSLANGLAHSPATRAQPPPVMVPVKPPSVAAASSKAEPAQKGSPAEAKSIPASLFDEPTRTLPVQMPPKAAEVAAAVRRQEAKAAVKSARQLPRIAISGMAIAGAVGLLVLWFALKPEPRGSGTLIVTVRPIIPAQVLVDGNPVGGAPFVGRSMPAGSHTVEVRASGYKTYTRTVTVAADPTPLQLVAELASDAPPPLVSPDVVLHRPQQKRPAEDDAPIAEQANFGAERQQKALAREAEPKPSALVPAKAPRPVAESSAAPEIAATEAPNGQAPKLRITTDPPGAAITVDGKPLGKSPALAEGLDPSHYHAVAATLEGYSAGRRAARLEASGTTLMHLTLQAKEQSDGTVPLVQKASPAEPASTQVAGAVGYLIAATSPVARVHIDGRETGRWTPVPPASPIALPAGDHTIVFVTAQGQRLEEQVSIEAGKTKSLIRKLR